MKAIEIISRCYHNRTKHRNTICSRFQSFFRCVHKATISNVMSVRPSVLLSTCINSVLV